MELIAVSATDCPVKHMLCACNPLKHGKKPGFRDWHGCWTVVRHYLVPLNLSPFTASIMFEDRNLKRDLTALGLAAFTVFLAIALVTYHNDDPIESLIAPLDQLYQPDILVYPHASVVQNACGRWGAMFADISFTLFGFGAYFITVSLGVVSFLVFQGRGMEGFPVRLAGWLLSLIGFTSFVALVMPLLSPGPIYGSGGLLGIIFRQVLEASFAVTGGLLLAICLFFGGLMLATDYVALRVMVAISRCFMRVTTRVARYLATEAGTSSNPTVATAAAGVPVAAKADDGRWTDDRWDETEIDHTEAYDDFEDEDEDESTEESDHWEDEDSTEEADAIARDDRLAVRISGHEVSDDGDSDAWPDDLDSELYADDLHDPGESDDMELVEEPTKPSRLKRMAGKLKKGEPRIKRRSSQSKDDQEKGQTALIESINEQPDDVFADYEIPSLDLLLTSEDINFDEQAREVRRNAKILEKTFADFGFNIRVVEIETGPVIAQYEVELEAGLRLSKITGLADDLAIALRVPSVRIVAPIPGKNTVGIEVPNKSQQLVRMREVIEDSKSSSKKMQIPVFLGKDVSGNPLAVDLCKMPHLLIAGRTGSGKSVCLHSIVTSILMARRPDEVRMLMIDPKMVELSVYGRLPHLMHPVVTDMKKAEAILAWAVEKMEQRYKLLAKAGVRHISSFNDLSEEKIRERLGPAFEDDTPTHMPYIVIVADELADLMMTAGKDVEQHIIRLAQKSRAVGIHLILATQKPTVDVITGLIKSNLPARIAFQVASRTDSRVVLDEMGAEKLLGNGDMLVLWPGTSTIIRGQGTFLGDEEINGVVDEVSKCKQNFVEELVHMKVERDGDSALPGAARKNDELYDAAIEIVIREGRGSVSLLQRTLGIGYGRGARLIDYMAEDGIVGDYNGSQAREVIVTMEQWQEIQAMAEANGAEAGKYSAADLLGDEDEDDDQDLYDSVDDEIASWNDHDDDEEDLNDEDCDDRTTGGSPDQDAAIDFTPASDDPTDNLDGEDDTRHDSPAGKRGPRGPRKLVRRRREVVAVVNEDDPDPDGESIKVITAANRSESMAADSETLGDESTWAEDEWGADDWDEQFSVAVSDEDLSDSEGLTNESVSIESELSVVIDVLADDDTGEEDDELISAGSEKMDSDDDVDDGDVDEQDEYDADASLAEEDLWKQNDEDSEIDTW